MKTYRKLLLAALPGCGALPVPPGCAFRAEASISPAVPEEVTVYREGGVTGTLRFSGSR